MSEKLNPILREINKIHNTPYYLKSPLIFLKLLPNIKSCVFSTDIQAKSHASLGYTVKNVCRFQFVRCHFSTRLISGEELKLHITFLFKFPHLCLNPPIKAGVP